MSDPIRLGAHAPDRAEWIEIQRILRESHGEIHRLEERVEHRVGDIVARPFGVAFASLGTAIEAALEALGAGPGSDVVLPALGPATVASSVVRAGARPLFADVDTKSLTLRETHASARVTSNTRVLIGIANHGEPKGLDEIVAVASRNELPMLEILAGGLGGRIGRDPVGRFGRISVVALGERESTIGSGGAVCVTNDDILASTLRLIRNDGSQDARQEWERIGGIRRIERVGTDARMGTLQAAFAAVRLERFDRISEDLEGVFHGYLRRLAMHPDLVLPAPCVEGMVRWSHFAVRLSERYSRDDRDSIVQGLLRHDIAASSVVHVLPLEPAFAVGHQPGDFPVAERAADRLIALPFSTELGEREIDLVCQTLQLMIERQSILR
ncbi:MAG: DegT/DnrJ/EryC1/StrS family aminotransferase [Planctomycetaceae bacterium]|nr:DegT/DnrJ/EryC1/StrS family aminotransferase [Planctomycetaceae bacterium]